jgi:hypothetical protein
MRSRPWVRNVLAIDGRGAIEHVEAKAPTGGPRRKDACRVRIRISDPSLARDLLEHLRAVDCVAMQLSGHILAVSLPQPMPYDMARLELDLHLTDWRTRHGHASAAVLD